MKNISHISAQERPAHKGFTLIELLVVIAIIAILTGIIIPNLTGSKAKARDAKRVADLGQIQLALELFYDRCKAYPNALSLDDNAAGKCPSGIKLRTFLPKIPTPPAPTTEYEYGPGPKPETPPYTDYILLVNLESNSSVLQDDVDSQSDLPSAWDSIINTGECADAAPKYAYCIISK